MENEGQQILIRKVQHNSGMANQTAIALSRLKGTTYVALRLPADEPTVIAPDPKPLHMLFFSRAARQPIRYCAANLVTISSGIVMILILAAPDPPVGNLFSSDKVCNEMSLTELSCVLDI